MRHLYGKLLITDSYKEISGGNYVDDLINSAVAWLPINKKFAINKHIEDFTLPSEATFPLGNIINELLTNATKHAFAGKDAGKIDFTLACKERRITLTVQDDGIGLPEGFNIRTSRGFGLMLVTILTKQLRGKFTLFNNNGTKSILEFDL